MERKTLFELSEELRELQRRVERTKRGTQKMTELRARMAEVERQIREVGSA